MRRIIGLLVGVLLTWFFIQRESAETSTGASPAGSVEVAPTPAGSPGSANATRPEASSGAQQSSANAEKPGATKSANSGKGFRDRTHLDDHYAKHGGEFPGLSKAQYLAMAQTLRDATTGADVLEIIRASDGVVSRFDRQSGAFIAFDRDGTIRTFFKPNDGEQYFRRQANRSR